ncbi:MAG: hypothetical protein OEL89_02495 [Candidatus Peregrinibacteria bacterium]|nr:hypothetical protein [Candidatus Peregrinibacteria bacterium]
MSGNTTLSVPKDLLARAQKVLKNQNSNLSLSAVVRQFLEDLAEEKYSVSVSVHPVFNSVEEEDEHLDKIEADYYRKHPEKMQEELEGIKNAVPADEVFKKAGLL